MSNFYGPYGVHPVADLFPLLEGEEFTSLVNDIGDNGLLVPIVLSPDGSQIVDGRNRYRACLDKRARRDPVFRKLDASAYDEEGIIRYIVSTNVHRRHLKPGQIALIAETTRPFLEKAAKERQRQSEGRGQKGAPELGHVIDERSGRVDRQLAEMFGIGHGTAAKAKKVVEDAPEFIAKVMAQKVSLDEAYAAAKAKATDADAKAEKKKQEQKKNKPPERTKLTLRTHEGKPVEYPLPSGKSTFNKTNDQISWANWSWNPVTGCLHGCKYCYARELSAKPSYAGAYPVGFTPLFHHERLDAPANTTVPKDAAADPRRKRVFVCSMADLYGKWVPDEWIEKVHASCAANEQWDYLMLTKFPRRYVGLKLPETAWLGTSVDEQKRVRFAEDAFRQISGVRVKWLSLEPLLAPLAFTDLSMFDWIVIGSQSATEQPDGHVKEFAPPFEWVSRIVAQAREAGCKVYLKPNLIGSVGPQCAGMQLPQEIPDGV